MSFAGLAVVVSAALMAFRGLAHNGGWEAGRVMVGDVVPRARGPEMDRVFLSIGYTQRTFLDVSAREISPANSCNTILALLSDDAQIPYGHRSLLKASYGFYELVDDSMKMFCRVPRFSPALRNFRGRGHRAETMRTPFERRTYTRASHEVRLSSARLVCDVSTDTLRLHLPSYDIVRAQSGVQRKTGIE
ncbi:hypothetical protein MAR_008967 [Mya arenaria]|uniref:Uncharacterized protein n=1 Tax=Mya arenaria TaxID=6604 RepID=A0ABY7DZF7_MYAAR|nr:hypothetical protein MAR_008967 [Mya arenaria]